MAQCPNITKLTCNNTGNMSEIKKPNIPAMAAADARSVANALIINGTMAERSLT
jgi:hypothetical protein